jgi:hypothetical protein
VNSRSFLWFRRSDRIVRVRLHIYKIKKRLGTAVTHLKMKQAGMSDHVL